MIKINQNRFVKIFALTDIIDTIKFKGTIETCIQKKTVQK